MAYVLTLPDMPPKTPEVIGAAVAVASAAILLVPLMRRFCHGFLHAPVRHKKCLQEDKAQWDHLSNSDVDDMVEESFPASDPPANY